MKKLLLSLACAVGLMTANAGVVTDVITVDNLKSDANYSATSTSYAEFSVTGESGAEYALQCAHNKGQYLQFRTTNNNSGVVVTKSAGKVTNVTLTWDSNSVSGRTVSVYSSNAAYANPAALYVTNTAGTSVGDIEYGKGTTLDVASAPFVGLRSKSGALYLTKIEITWETEGEGPTLAKPAISCTDNTVTITAAEGDIYYTLDGTAPSAASTKYTAPFAITESCTVKAIAIKGTETSAVATLDVTYVGNYNGFAAFIADKGTGTVDGPISAIYMNGRNLYLKDSKGAYLLSYNSNSIAYPETITNGDVLASITGAYKDQNGLPELIPSALGEITAGTAVEPETVAVEELSADMLNAYVRIENVKIEAAAKANNYNLSDETGTVLVYNTFSNSNYYNVVDVPEGEGFTFEGFVSIYSGTIQLTPIKIVGGVETVATPTFSVAAGEVDPGTTVAISCATEGASIFYTTDGTEPTIASDEYSEPIAIDADTTIKAIAVKEGYTNSAVATAAYTVKVIADNVATFVFTSPTSLGDYPASTADAQAAYEADNAGAIAKDGNNDNYYANMTDVKLYNSNVYVVVYDTDDTDKGTAARLYYQSGGAIQLRAYKKSTIEIGSVDANNKITKVVMNLNNTSNGFATDVPVTYANKVVTYESAEGVESIALPITTNNMQINTIEVTCQSKLSGVENISVADENAPVEYFNLQGVRVANPTAGQIVIRRQGATATKVLVK